MGPAGVRFSPTLFGAYDLRDSNPFILPCLFRLPLAPTILPGATSDRDRFENKDIRRHRRNKVTVRKLTVRSNYEERSRSNERPRRQRSADGCRQGSLYGHEEIARSTPVRRTKLVKSPSNDWKRSLD